MSRRQRRGEPQPLAASAATCGSQTASPAIQMKCHSCLASKKWLKSPHNRFKFASKQARRISAGRSRSQKTIRVSSTPSSPPPLLVLKQTIAPQNRKLKLAIGILFILNLAVSMFAAAATASNITSSSSSSQIRSTASQQVATSTNSPSLPLATPKRATTRRSPAGTSSRFDNEDEVDLLRPVINQPIEQVRHTSSQPHIYRIRAAPLNGKLSLPAPSSIRQIQISDALIGHKRPLQVAKQADKPAPLQTTTTMDTLQDTTTSANFGFRAGSPRQVTSTPGNQRGHQNQQDHEHCKQPSEDNHEVDQSGGSSIAASSPTLRLTTGANRTVTQLIGSQPDVKASIASARSTQNAGLGSNQAGRFRESPGEVEELPSRDFEVRFGADSSLLQTLRTKPTLISARASTSGSGGTSQPPARSNGSPLRLTSSFAETSLATEPLNADLDDPIGSESRPTSGVVAGGTDSILSLIDDFDSKIITNRTKAQLSCDSGEMILRLNFSEPFKGIVYPDHNRLSPCRFFGDGHHNYELRLPLRGCGTRQAAPRVFVNDVIVRFHKTLELEEDEVKTLICRYPPPLASIPLESSSGSQVATSAANSSNVNNNNNNNNSNSPGNGPQAAPGEPPNEHLDGQFEFVDPNSGRVRPEPGSSGHIETISENLVVAPSGGQQQQQFGTGLNPYSPGNSNNNRLNANIRQQSNQATPVDLFNQRNSFSSGQGNNNAFGSAETTATNHLQQQNYFERLSSIELLFLISSLMFLVLLTLGLIGSFYCFRRQANRNSDQRASAILKRKRRYLSPGAAAALSGPTLHQYQSQRSGRHTGALAPISASPSPGSDLSNRGLLAGSSSSLSVGPTGQHYNRAYQLEPPSGNLQRYLAAATGGPHYASQFATNLADYHQPQHARAGIVRAPLVIDPVNHLKRQQLPVLGRRDTTVYGHLQNGATIQRGHKRHLSPAAQATGGHRQSQAKLRGATTFTSGAQLQPDMDAPVDGQPLLLPYTVGPQYLHSDEHYRNRATLRAKLHPAAPGQLVSAQYALVNKPQHQSRFAMDQQVYDDQTGAHYKQQQGQLWRAKSLTSIQQVGEDMHEFGGRKSRPIIGGTLSRHEQAISGKRHRYLPVAGDRGHSRGGGGGVYEATLQFSNGSSGSYSESEPEFEQNNNEFRHRNGDQQQPPKVKPKPTILLKSIEDSYITNFTEIHEQEYMKRDSMRPLSMGSWRAMQPERNRGKPGKNYHDDDNNDGDDDDEDGHHHHHQNERSGSERDREEEEGEEEQRYPSAQTNLRSLTELDVNFARSPESARSGTLRPTVSMDQVGPGIGATGSRTEQSAIRSHKKKMEDQKGQSRSTPERSISVPDVGAIRDEQESPDLILSPDYDYDRLELKPEAGRSSPHNSVSYV